MVGLCDILLFSLNSVAVCQHVKNGCVIIIIIEVLLTDNTGHGRSGPVLSGGGVAGGSGPNIFSIACPKVKWFCLNINCFLTENGLLEKKEEEIYPPHRTRLW